MKISVVTAVFNRRDTIGDALQSVADQTYPSLEHVVQDGASSDGTLDILKRWQAHTLHLESAPDKGIYDAINRGIKRASGDVIGLMHSDDFFASPDILSKVGEVMDDPDVDGVYGDLDYISASDPSKVVRRWKSGVYEQGNLAKGWMPPHPTLYLRREVFDRFGLYDTSYSIAADYEAMLRYLVTGKIRLAYLPETFVKMRVGGESNRSLKKILIKSKEDYRAMSSHNVGGLLTLLQKNSSKIRQFL